MATNDTETTGKTFDVGHGKPPKHSRWPKGHSGNRKGRPKKKQAFSIGEVLAAKVDEEIKLKGARREGKLPRLRYMLRGIVENAARDDNRAVEIIEKILSARETAAPPNKPDWLILTYEEGMVIGKERLTEAFFVEQERQVKLWEAELRKGSASLQQMLKLELIRRVPVIKNGKQVKVPIIEVIAARILREANTDTRVAMLLLKLLPEKKYQKPHRIQILRPTQRDVEWWGATAQTSPG